MDVLNKILAAGIVGAGGAGFPTHVKLAVKDIKWLIINASECEPLLQTDIYVAKTYADEIIGGVDILVEQLGFEHAVIGIKRKHSAAIAALEKAIADRGSKAELFFLDSFYPSGDEQVLIYEITKQTVPPGGIPLSIGVVVVNSTTAYTIYNATLDRPVISKTITITGEVNQPVIAEVAVGTSVADCLALAGGTTVADHFFIMGGPMMGKQYDSDMVDKVFVSKADSGIIVLPTDHHLKTFLAKPLSWVKNQTRSACIQCEFCTDMCPRFLIGHQMRPSRVMRALGTETHTKALTEAFLCCECGICELYACPMQLSPRQVNIMMKQALREQGITEFDRNIYPQHTAAFAYRKIPQKRIVHRLQLDRYDHPIEKYAELAPSRVSIAYKHGIGGKASPIVKTGDRVNKGDLIAQIGEKELGSNIHASIDGVVVDTTDYLVIEKA